MKNGEEFGGCQRLGRRVARRGHRGQQERCLGDGNLSRLVVDTRNYTSDITIYNAHLSTSKSEGICIKVTNCSHTNILVLILSGSSVRGHRQGKLAAGA